MENMNKATKTWPLVNNACLRAHELQMRLEIERISITLFHGSFTDQNEYQFFQMREREGVSHGVGGQHEGEVPAWYIICDKSEEMRNQESSYVGDVE